MDCKVLETVAEYQIAIVLMMIQFCLHFDMR